MAQPIELNEPFQVLRHPARGFVAFDEENPNLGTLQ